jgi:hypothetical protein
MSRILIFSFVLWVFYSFKNSTSNSSQVYRKNLPDTTLTDRKQPVDAAEILRKQDISIKGLSFRNSKSQVYKVLNKADSTGSPKEMESVACYSGYTQPITLYYIGDYVFVGDKDELEFMFVTFRKADTRVKLPKMSVSAQTTLKELAIYYPDAVKKKYTIRSGEIEKTIVKIPSASGEASGFMFTFTNGRVESFRWFVSCT